MVFARLRNGVCEYGPTGEFIHEFSDKFAQALGLESWWEYSNLLLTMKGKLRIKELIARKAQGERL